jgi:exodeoxyribonuclease III
VLNSKGTRIVSLNIRHGGGGRANRLADWIIGQAPFAAVVTEWRDNASGQQIRSSFSSAGLDSFSTGRGPRINTTLLAARSFAYSEIITPPNSFKGDLVLMRLDRLAILGCYFPQRMAKAVFFERCMEIALRESLQPLLVIGDFNTGRNDLDVDGAGTPFDCADQFIGLTELAGLADLWRFRHGERREWTWRSAKNGFRIDHAFGNEAFVSRFPNYRCEIDHEPRLIGLTDHSAVVLDLG